MEYFIGVDIGGTNLKAGIVNMDGVLISETSIPTGASRPQEVVLEDILTAVHEVLLSSGLRDRDIRAAGVGSPGITDSDTGTVIYNNNLGWRNFQIGPLMSERLGIPVRLENDADAAALGEVVTGSAKGASSAMIITLGTGVGTGYVLGGKIHRGCEFGHMVISHGGRLCTCGRRGCFEAYCSATGLINMTTEAIARNPKGIISDIAHREGIVSGHTVFEASERGDEEALRIIEEYTDYLACGLVNLINGLHPEYISIGGGIGKQGERLLEPLREKVCAEVYGERETGQSYTKIVSCTLGYKAGLIGAAMSVRDL